MLIVLIEFLLQDFLFISNSRNRSLISYSKTQATTISLGQFLSTVTPVAMTIFSAEAQPFTIEDHEARKDERMV